MKKIISILVLAFMVISFAFSINAFADNDDSAGAYSYDSLNFPDTALEGFKSRYDILKKDSYAAEAYWGYDIEALVEREGMVMIYHNWFLMDYFLKDKSIIDIANDSSTELLKSVPRIEDSNKFEIICDDDKFFEQLNIGNRKHNYNNLIAYALDPSLVFSKSNVMKEYDNVIVEKTFVCDTFGWESGGYGSISSIIYYVTNHGDFVYCNVSMDAPKFDEITEYVFPIDIFKQLLKEVKSIEKFYLANVSLYGDPVFLQTSWIKYLNTDTSYYKVSAPCEYSYSEDFSSYYIGTKMGYTHVTELTNDLTLGGFKHWVDFKSKMDAAGYTTAEEYKAALDAAIAENQKNQESGDLLPTETAPPDRSGGKKFSHLYWIIPMAIIILAAAVILPVILRKRKGN